jgi:hypothetical protein
MGAMLDQPFDPEAAAYTAVVGFLTNSIGIAGTPEDAAATIAIEGTPPDEAGIVIELAEGENPVTVSVTAPDGTSRDYSLTVTRQPAAAFAQDAYIKASNTGAGDGFGYSVAVFNDTLAVGAPFEDGAGAGVDADEGDSSALESGAVYVFTRSDAGVWSQQAYIKASNADGSDALPGDQFGTSVALSGDTLAVGAPFESSGVAGDETDESAFAAGAVYVFTRTGESWTQEAYLKASNVGQGDYFGQALALSGDTLAVGAPREDSIATGIDGDQGDERTDFAAGAVYVFSRSERVWLQQAYIKASNAGERDYFGHALSLSGNRLAVGAYGEASAATGIGGDQGDDSADRSGAAYTFTRDADGTWSQEAYIKASNADAADQFGWALALSGDTLAVGAESEAGSLGGGEADNGASRSGAVYVFVRDPGGDWMQAAYLKASNADAGDRFGYAVTLSDGTLAVGAYREASSAVGVGGGQSDNDTASAGAVYLFSRDGAGGWSQRGYLKAASTGPDFFGHAVALAGDTVAVGAPAESSTATGIDGDPRDDGAFFAGSVYLFGGVPSRLAALSMLGLDGVGLDQIFQADQPVYSASVGFLGASVRLQAVAETAGAIVRVDGARTSAEGIDLALLAGENTFEIENTAEDGVTTVRYTLTITRASAAALVQSAYVKASNTFSDDWFGYALALSGNTLAVGAPREDSVAIGIDGDQSNDSETDSGAVYVLTSDGAGLWSQQAYIKASNTNLGDWFGRAVALSGDTLAVGAPYEDSDAMGIGGDESDDSLSNAGAVYIFTRDAGGAWSQQAYIKASNSSEDDQFGYSVALFGDTLAVGVPDEDSAATGVDNNQADDSATRAGAVYLFTRDATGAWSQQAYIKASNTDEGDAFGFAVALSGDTLAVGAPYESSDGDPSENNRSRAGAAYVFARIGARWFEQQYVKASDIAPGPLFGYAIALSASTLAVGAPLESSNAVGIDGEQINRGAPGSGAVYMFGRDGNQWLQQAYVKASNSEESDHFGVRVSASSGTVAVAAQGEDSAATGVGGNQDSNTGTDSGAAYVFARDGSGRWSQQAYVKASNAGQTDATNEALAPPGMAIALSGDTLAFTAPFEDSAAMGVNGDETSEDADDAGAAYVFE